MKYRWLVMLACIFVTACDSSSTEEAEKPVEKNTTAETKVKTDSTEKATANNATTEKATAENTNAAAEMVAQYSVAFEEFIAEIRKAKNQAERAEAMKANPNAEFGAKFRELASENPDSEIEATALAWLASNSDQAEEKVSALATLMENYSDSPAMKDATVAILRSGKPSQAAEDNLRKIIENSPHREARGAAVYHLVMYLDRYKSYRENIDRIASDPRAVTQFGEEGIEYLRNLKVDDAEMEGLYETIVKDYADVAIAIPGRDATIIGDSAKNALFEIRNLSMGCVAPEIEGADLDGKEFALSDYRGKVVMLDFWGDW